MKIRHRQSGVELEGEFCDCAHSGTGIPSRSYFSDIHSGSLYDKVCWEAVPEWVDVTGALHEYTGWWHGNDLVVPYLPLRSPYRLRKVQVSIDGLPKYAFIVERKV